MTSLLTVWMTVIGLGVSVTHAHATGGARHVHGSGWNLSFCPVVPLSVTNGTDEAHRHLYLLGIEFPNESTPDTVPANVSATEPAIAQSCDSLFLEDLSQSAIDSPVFGYALNCCPNCLIQDFAPRLDPSVTLSTFARRALAGVLRS
ncbi:MAG: hypothetical protein KF873_20410 [Gemmataceae bacterium]|nr:hypothetical protein [Gemmataceae bacterium]